MTQKRTSTNRQVGHRGHEKQESLNQRFHCLTQDELSKVQAMIQPKVNVNQAIGGKLKLGSHVGHN